MTAELHVNRVRELRAEGHDWEQITDRMRESGIPEDEAVAAIGFVKKERRAKNRNLGMILLALGSACCFFSLMFTFMFGHNYFILYGITMLGVTIAFAGLVYVMG